MSKKINPSTKVLTNAVSFINGVTRVVSTKLNPIPMLLSDEFILMPNIEVSYVNNRTIGNSKQDRNT